MDVKHTHPENLKRLTLKHLALYRAMLSAAQQGEPNLRPSELKTLLATWEGVRIKEYRWSMLSRAERSEVEDAIESGE